MALIFSGSIISQNASISNIQVLQRTDGSGLVDVHFDLAGTESSYYINLEASFDSGIVYNPVTINRISGDTGPISPGNSKYIVWDGFGSFPNTLSLQAKLKVIASKYPPGGTGSVIDIDGNIYQTIVIGTQEWMAENLKVTHYRNGDVIPNVTSDIQWIELSTGAYCWNSNSMIWGNPYGGLYNWFAVVDSRGLCPVGWHTPTDEEWIILTNYLGGQIVAGGKLKSIRTGPNVSHPRWTFPNTGATNESGFSGSPGGGRGGGGSFFCPGEVGHFWSSTEYEDYPNEAFCRWLGYVSVDFFLDVYPKTCGLSVRCLRD